MSEPKTITINDVRYVREDSVSATPLYGRRAVFVIDRGWVVAGDVTEANGRILLSRAVHVISWSGIGFAGMIAEGKSGKVKLAPLPNGFNIPSDSEIFRVSVVDSWGL